MNSYLSPPPENRKPLVLRCFDPSRPVHVWKLHWNKKKKSLIFIFTLLYGASKGFMKAFKAFWGTTKKCKNKDLT